MPPRVPKRASALDPHSVSDIRSVLDLLEHCAALTPIHALVEPLAATSVDAWASFRTTPFVGLASLALEHPEDTPVNTDGLARRLLLRSGS